MRRQETGRSRWIASGGLVITLAVAAACAPVPTAGPGVDVVPPAAGGGVVGVNPDVAGTPGATSAVVTYGPFTVPAATGTAHGQEGMLTRVLSGIRKPCTGCHLTAMHTTLTYPDGRDANIDTGQWLHHGIFASWPRRDATCANSVLGLLGERFFATGNERSRARFPAGYGYPVAATDSWQLSFDLMNSTPAPSTVQIETTFEWVPATTPGMKALRPVWIDATHDCLNSGLPPQTGSYSYATDWVVNRPGRVIGVGAHMHDGGTHLTLTNTATGALICNAVSGYGGPGYVEGAGGGDGHDHGGGGDDDGHAMMHISSITECVAPDGNEPVATIAAGQRVRLVVYYDTAKHAQQGDHPVMGVSLVYVAS
jgi:hypothetical protein